MNAKLKTILYAVGIIGTIVGSGLGNRLFAIASIGFVIFLASIKNTNEDAPK